MTDLKAAEALSSVLKGSTWIGAILADAYIKLNKNQNEVDIARGIYQSGAMALTRAKELVPEIRSSGFIKYIPERKKVGSAENPITKLFPAAITEQRFLSQLESIRQSRNIVNYDDNRFTGHTLVDFTLVEGTIELPINVKNAGTRFKNAKQIVGLEPEDCIPIPVYKAYDAIEKEPNLLYLISVDYLLIETVRNKLITLFDENEMLTWEILNSHAGKGLRDAEDKFVYGMTLKYWEELVPNLNHSSFHVISARKAIRILQKQPKRTPGIGLRAWGTGANAEVNVHISISDETKPWEEVQERIVKNGLTDIVDAINRRRTELVYDPEI